RARRWLGPGHDRKTFRTNVQRGDAPARFLLSITPDKKEESPWYSRPTHNAPSSSRVRGLTCASSSPATGSSSQVTSSSRWSRTRKTACGCGESTSLCRATRTPRGRKTRYSRPTSANAPEPPEGEEHGHGIARQDPRQPRRHGARSDQ